MIARADAIDVVFLILPHVLLLDVAGAAEAFRLANQQRAWRDLPPRFRLRFVSPAADVVSSVGLTLGPLEALPDSLGGATWIVVSGQPTEHLSEVTPETTCAVRWLARVLGPALRDPSSAHRLVTICSGALLAARAGLLDGRRCTTHHALLDTLRALAPNASVVENRVFALDGPVVSSAGITAGIDVALQLVAEECGDDVAARVADEMVVYLRRSERDPERSPFRRHRGHRHTTVHRVQDAMSGAPERDWTMESLADVGHTTPRHLLRLFVEHAGVSPLGYLQAIRLERARQALAHGATVTHAASIAGFRSDGQLRRAWGRVWGGAPRDEVRARRGPAAL